MPEHTVSSETQGNSRVKQRESRTRSFQTVSTRLKHRLWINVTVLTLQLSVYKRNLNKKTLNISYFNETK